MQKYEYQLKDKLLGFDADEGAIVKSRYPDKVLADFLQVCPFGAKK